MDGGTTVDGWWRFSPSPEGPVIRRWLGLLFAGVLIAFVVPLLAIERFFARCLPGRSAALPDLQAANGAKEFGFDRAIEAYEALIDEAARRRG